MARINFLTSDEIKEKLERVAEANGISVSDIIRIAVDNYFKKEDEKEILISILQRLDKISELNLTNQTDNLNNNLIQIIHKMIVEIYIQSVRTNVFLNKYTEGYLLKPEDYKDLRKRVSDEMGTIIKNEGLEKK